MKINQLRKKNISDLKTELLNLFREQFNLRIQSMTGKLKQTHFLREVRKSIARVQTLLTKKGSKL